MKLKFGLNYIYLIPITDTPHNKPKSTRGPILRAILFIAN